MAKLEHEDTSGEDKLENLSENTALIGENGSSTNPHLSGLKRPRWVGQGKDQRSFSTGKLRFPSSLDFERVINEYSIQATRDRVMEEIPDDEEDLLDRKLRTKPKTNVFGYTGRTAARWVLTMATGLATGLISIVIVSATDRIQTWRSSQIDKYWMIRSAAEMSGTRDRDIPIFFLYILANLALALLSCGICISFAPEAVGSGIPEVKAYLNGVRVKRFSSIRLFVVKIVATILSVSSGLAIGPEGPLVHIGAMLGASFTKMSSFFLRVLPKQWTSRLWSLAAVDFANFSTDGERRDLVSIGAAAGFAAAFGAPIGGLLFTMEEASSYFEHGMFMKTLVATSIATFCIAVHHGDLSDYSIISLKQFEASDGNIFANRVEQLPLYVIVAISGGLLGGFFCKAWRVLQLNRQQVPFSRRRLYNLLEVALVSLLTSFVCYFVPKLNFLYCRDLPDLESSMSATGSTNNAWLDSARQFDCPKGQINELATIIFGSREAAISSILGDPSQFSLATLLTVGFIFFPLMTMTLGVSLPSGIFMPTFLIGCSLGGAAGLIFDDLLEADISPSTFALLGAAALLAGIQRSTVSLCVILVEGTGQVKVLIPVIIVVVVARYVGDIVSHHGLYEIAMDINGYPYLDHARKKQYDVFTVGQIMSSPVHTLQPREMAKDLVSLLRKSSHHGFPVASEDGQFLGLVRRDQIVALLECGIFHNSKSSGDEEVLSDRSSALPPARYSNIDWVPKPGIGKSSLMHLAFYIGDDRYDHLDVGNASTQTILDGLDEDEYDSNAWLVSVRNSRHLLAGRTDDKVPFPRQASLETSSSYGSTRSAVSQGTFATVATNRKGNIYVKSLEPRCSEMYVDLAAVMNRGTYCVTETTPLSKARLLFTSLGLRHLVVLGPANGEVGKVTGILTRVNFLKSFVDEKTRCHTSPAEPY